MKAGTSVITLDAKPEPVEIDCGRCAVLVVDMQNDFGSRGGMFDRVGIDIAPIERVVEPTARVLAAARSVGLPIVYLKMQHSPGLADTGGPGSPHSIKHARLGVGKEVPAPDGRASRILVAGTWNTDFLPRLAPQAGDVIVPKHRYSGFFQTDLDRVLSDRDIKHLVVAGCTTSVCVESTVRDAMFRDYHCVVLADCTAEPIANDQPRTNHEASLLTIQLLFGWVSDSGRLIAALAR
ncbi:peroxyureidoacrylate/ureidoacrylate amidohydrolase RutB [Siccirubricoccus deserti]|uniref:Isochorismatase family protein n=1 Tax=Siccirubricoccus deserti TaxID=2013562 RepID=A0A9X0R2Q9_9PROT|nr:cysteine hydrolase [Siccirubricoccus deserti]MBC4018644.1 isochorismatase family protein [Siccirubricoccus deserti]GGC67396.1 peroxyureidoacrylate/ureidoacrylate amidohydrolase RutB [Siccirubricoccus deserti]